MTTDKTVDELDTIEVPDELSAIIANTAKPETDEKGKDAAPEENKDGVDDEEKDVKEEGQPEKQEWKPKHNPEYYKKKGERTREHIRKLTTARYEAEQRAEELWIQRENDAALIEELREKVASQTDYSHDPKIKQIDEAIEVAEEEDRPIIVEALKSQRERVVSDKQKKPEPKEPQYQKQEHEQQTDINPAAKKWIDTNAWFSAKDDLGRTMYPQLIMQAQRLERNFRESMPLGEPLYKKLDEAMAETLDAYGLLKAGNDEAEDEAEERKSRKPSRPAVQPSRGGGAETNGGGPDHLSDKDAARMKFVFKKTGMDYNNPKHRQIYLNNLRSS